MKGSSRSIGDVALPHSVWCKAALSSVSPSGDVVWKSVWSVWSERLPDGGRRDVGSKEEAELLCASLGLSVDWDGYGFRLGHVVFPVKETV